MAADSAPERTRPTRRFAFVLVGYAFLVVMVGTTLPTPLYPIYQAEYGYSGLTTTVIFAVYAIGVIAALLLFGRLSDQIGRRPVLLGGIVCSALSAVVFLLSGSLTPLLIGRFLSGLSAGVFTGTATATLLDLVPDRRRPHAGLVAAVVNMLGLGLGPVLAGLLAEFAPAPLRLPYAVSLALLVPAALGVALQAEPRPGSGRVDVRPQRLRVPPAARSLFVRASIAGFAGFAVLGLFSAVSPLFLGEVLGVHDHAVVGLVVFALLGTSTLGQVLTSRGSEHRALRGGSLVLAVGTALVGASLALASFPLLLAGAVVAGFGQGASFRAGLTSVGRISPPDQRAEVSSSFFVICYVAISIPVIGVGALAQAVGLVAAGTAFSALVVLLALIAVALLRGPAD
ncbi:MAG TPA: MFS transporter [Pseudonocardia sp.]